MAAMREPAALVLRREEVMPEIASEVVVALVPVAFTKVKFCKVEEPMTRRSPEELMVVVAVPPILKELPVKRLAKELVEVAEVVVDWLARKPPVKVEEAVEMKQLRKPKVVELEFPWLVGVPGKAKKLGKLHFHH